MARAYVGPFCSRQLSAEVQDQVSVSLSESVYARGGLTRERKLPCPCESLEMPPAPDLGAQGWHGCNNGEDPGDCPNWKPNPTAAAEGSRLAISAGKLAAGLDQGRSKWESRQAWSRLGDSQGLQPFLDLEPPSQAQYTPLTLTD